MLENGGQNGQERVFFPNTLFSMMWDVLQCPPSLFVHIVSLGQGVNFYLIALVVP